MAGDRRVWSAAEMLVGYPIDKLLTRTKASYATGVAPINFAQVFHAFKDHRDQELRRQQRRAVVRGIQRTLLPGSDLLGGSGHLDVRAIDSLVVDLINRRRSLERRREQYVRRSDYLRAGADGYGDQALAN